MGKAYSDEEEYANAVDAYQRAIEINPTNYRVYINMGWDYYQMGYYENAIQAEQQALEIIRDETIEQSCHGGIPHEILEIQWKLGLSYLANGQSELAATEFDKSIRAGNWDASGEDGEALLALQKLIAVHPNLSGTQKILDRLEKGFGTAKQIAANIRLYQNDVKDKCSYGGSDWWNEAGIILWRQNEPLETIGIAFSEALELNPSSLKALNNDAMLALLQNDSQRCRQRASTALSVMQTDPYYSQYPKGSLVFNFYQWLCDPERNLTPLINILNDIDGTPFLGYHPSTPITLNSLIPIFERYDESTRQIAEYFIAFFTYDIDLPTLKERLAQYE